MADADAIMAKLCAIEAAVAAHAQLTTPTVVVNETTLGELWDRKRAHKIAVDPAWKRYDTPMKAPLAYFASWPVRLINQAAWDDYVAARVQCNSRKGGKIKMSSIICELDHLKGTCSWAEKRGELAANPVAKIVRPKQECVSQPPMREEHLDRLLDAAGTDFMRAFILVAMDAGPRANEVRNIRWKRIDWETREIELTVTKGNRPRTIVVTRRSLAALHELRGNEAESPFVFYNPKRGRPWSNRRLAELLVAAVEASGIEAEYDGQKIRAHALRHGYATNAIERGVAPHAVQRQLGHASLEMTQRYIDLRNDFLRAAADIFEAGILRERKRRGPKRAPNVPKPLQESTHRALA